MSSFKNTQIALAVKKMSSREIAELTGKRHDNVMRTVRDLISARVLTSQIEESNFEHQGNTYKQFLLNKRDSLVVVARLSPDFTASVVDRWQELESQQLPVSQFIIPSNLHEALRFAADLAEQKAVLEEQVQANAPKVQFHDLVTEAVNCQSIEQVAKVLGTGRNRFFAWLRKKDFLKEDNQPYQPYIDRGYFKVIEAQYNDKKHGDSHTYTKTLITGKGLTFFQKRFVAEVA